MHPCGAGSLDLSNEVNALDLETRAWSKMAVFGDSPPPERMSAVMAVVGSALVVYGGWIYSHGEVGPSCVDQFDSKSQSILWIELRMLENCLSFLQSHAVPKSMDWTDTSHAMRWVAGMELIHRLALTVNISTPTCGDNPFIQKYM